MGGMGNERTAFWTERLNKEIRPSILVNIGIAGGIHEDVLLGDVVVANQVENYLADAKAKPSKIKTRFEFSLAGDPYKTDSNLVNRAQNMEFAYPKEFQAWKAECGNASAEIPPEHLEALLRNSFIRQKPCVEEGHVACGPVVAAAEEFVIWLKNISDRTFLAIEMESAGGALALYESATGTRHLVIRGISDFGDSRKKDLDNIECGAVRKLAMQNATRFLFSLLKLLSEASLTKSGGKQ
jgi:nucleoside phosphorylase